MAVQGLLDEIRELEPDIRRRLAWMYPGATPSGQMRLRPLSVVASHPLVAIEFDGPAGVKLLMKGRRKHDRIHQSLETEHRVLTDVAPRMQQHSEATRCPRVIAYYPERDLLLMELIEGDRLDRLQFGLGVSGRPERLPGLLARCAEWLAEFHRVTRLDEEGNPFQWLLGLLEDPRRRRLFEEHWDANGCRELCGLVRQLQRRYHDVRQPLCLIHGEYASYHVLVRNGFIYVIDLASSRKGYAVEDLAFFTAFFDVLLPWRCVAGSMRMNLDAQKAVFVDTYLARSGMPRDPALLVLRLARLQAMAALLGHFRVRNDWHSRLYSMIAWPWVHRRFRAKCRRELATLRAVVAEETTRETDDNNRMSLQNGERA